MENRTMPRNRSEQPAYQYHVSGQAKVRLGSKDFYLGKHGTPESYAKYYSLLAEYNANGIEPPKSLPDEVGGDSSDSSVRMADDLILVKHITADFRARVLPRYENNNSHHGRFTALCNLLDKRHGNEPASEFGPRKLATLRDGFVAKGNCRSYANDQTRKLIKIIEHGVSRELIGPDRIIALRTLPSLKHGEARDNPTRSGVPLDVVRATLPHLTETAADMVRLQLATAMRPSELFKMTPAMIDQSGDIWFYRPNSHKSQHHGKKKAIPILGAAMETLKPYLGGDSSGLCFLTTKSTPWNKDSYRIAVKRAAQKAKVEHWTPYMLRHESLQTVRDTDGPEAAQALAGHSRLSTTEIYAKVSESTAIRAARAAPQI